MKRMLEQKMIDYIAKLQKVIDTNSDGAVSVEDFEVSGDFSVNATKMINLDTENALFPLENNAGKVLLVNSGEDGMEATDELEITSLDASGSIQGSKILEKMTGYSAELSNNLDTWNKEVVYCGAVKTGNKLTLAISIKLERLSTTTDNSPQIVKFYLPSDVMDKLIPTSLAGYSWLDQKNIFAFSSATDSKSVPCRLSKQTDYIALQIAGSGLTQDVEYILRYEVTFLLSDSLITTD